MLSFTEENPHILKNIVRQHVFHQDVCEEFGDKEPVMDSDLMLFLRQSCIFDF